MTSEKVSGNFSFSQVQAICQKTIRDIQKLTSGRSQKNITIVTDERSNIDDNLGGFHENVFILKINGLKLESVFTTIKTHPKFGNGTIWVFSGGTHDVLLSEWLQDCLDFKCPNPPIILTLPTFATKSSHLIDVAVQLNLDILQSTENDIAVFCGLIPVCVNRFNRYVKSHRQCTNLHNTSQIAVDPIMYSHYTYIVKLYNDFTKYHAQALGYSPWDLEVPEFGKKISIQRQLLSNGYHINPDEDIKQARKAELLCEELLNSHQKQNMKVEPAMEMHILFIDRLSCTTTAQSLKHYFEQFGEVVRSVVMKNRKNISEGFGFVAFSSSSMADEALHQLQHVVDRLIVDVIRIDSSLFKLPESGSKECLEVLSQDELQNPAGQLRKLYVSGLDQGVSEVSFRDYFSEFGEVERVKINKDKSGHGLVLFTLDSAVDESLMQISHKINGSNIVAEKGKLKARIYNEGLTDTQRMKESKERLKSLLFQHASLFMDQVHDSPGIEYVEKDNYFMYKENIAKNLDATLCATASFPAETHVDSSVLDCNRILNDSCINLPSNQSAKIDSNVHASFAQSSPPQDNIDSYRPIGNYAVGDNILPESSHGDFKQLIKLTLKLDSQESILKENISEITGSNMFPNSLIKDCNKVLNESWITLKSNQSINVNNNNPASFAKSSLRQEYFDSCKPVGNYAIEKDILPESSNGDSKQVIKPTINLESQESILEENCSETSQTTGPNMFPNSSITDCNKVLNDSCINLQSNQSTNMNYNDPASVAKSSLPQVYSDSCTPPVEHYAVGNDRPILQKFCNGASEQFTRPGPTLKLESQVSISKENCSEIAYSKCNMNADSLSEDCNRISNFTCLYLQPDKSKKKSSNVPVSCAEDSPLQDTSEGNGDSNQVKKEIMLESCDVDSEEVSSTTKQSVKQDNILKENCTEIACSTFGISNEYINNKIFENSTKTDESSEVSVTLPYLDDVEMGSEPTLHSPSFNKVFVVGNKELIKDEFSGVDQSKLIYHCLNDFKENNVQDLLLKAKSLPENSVCCLVFDISIIGTKLVVSTKSNKLQFIKVLYVKRLNSYQNLLEFNHFFSCLVETVNNCASKISEFLPVIILPLVPKRIYCDEYSRSDKLFQKQKDFGPYVLSGSCEMCREVIKSAVISWNILIEAFNIKYHQLNCISNYLSTNPITYPILEWVSDLNLEWTEYKSWKTMAENVFSYLVPINIEADSLESSTNHICDSSLSTIINLPLSESFLKSSGEFTSTNEDIVENIGSNCAFAYVPLLESTEIRTEELSTDKKETGGETFVERYPDISNSSENRSLVTSSMQNFSLRSNHEDEAECSYEGSEMTLRKTFESHSFSNIFVVGKKALIDMSFDCGCQDKSKLICYNLNDFEDIHIQDMLQTVKSLPENSVCCLVFDITIIGTETLNIKSCYSTQNFNALNATPLDSDQSLVDFKEQFSNLIQIIKRITAKLSEFLPVIILPLVPKRIYCNENPQTSTAFEILKLFEPYVLRGTSSLCREAIQYLLGAWSTLIKAQNKDLIYLDCISSYLATEPETYAVMDYAGYNELDPHLSEYSSWKDLAEEVVHSFLGTQSCIGLSSTGGIMAKSVTPNLGKKKILSCSSQSRLFSTENSEIQIGELQPTRSNGIQNFKTKQLPIFFRRRHRSPSTSLSSKPNFNKSSISLTKKEALASRYPDHKTSPKSSKFAMHWKIKKSKSVSHSELNANLTLSNEIFHSNSAKNYQFNSSKWDRKINSTALGLRKFKTYKSKILQRTFITTAKSQTHTSSRHSSSKPKDNSSLVYMKPSCRSRSKYRSLKHSKIRSLSRSRSRTPNSITCSKTKSFAKNNSHKSKRLCKASETVDKTRSKSRSSSSNSSISISSRSQSLDKSKTPKPIINHMSSLLIDRGKEYISHLKLSCRPSRSRSKTLTPSSISCPETKSFGKTNSHKSKRLCKASETIDKIRSKSRSSSSNSSSISFSSRSQSVEKGKISKPSINTKSSSHINERGNKYRSYSKHSCSHRPSRSGSKTLTPYSIISLETKSFAKNTSHKSKRLCKASETVDKTRSKSRSSSSNSSTNINSRSQSVDNIKIPNPSVNFKSSLLIDKRGNKYRSYLKRSCSPSRSRSKTPNSISYSGTNKLSETIDKIRSKSRSSSSNSSINFSSRSQSVEKGKISKPSINTKSSSHINERGNKYRSYSKHSCSHSRSGSKTLTPYSIISLETKSFAKNTSHKSKHLCKASKTFDKTRSKSRSSSSNSSSISISSRSQSVDKRNIPKSKIKCKGPSFIDKADTKYRSSYLMRLCSRSRSRSKSSSQKGKSNRPSKHKSRAKLSMSHDLRKSKSKSLTPKSRTYQTNDCKMEVTYDKHKAKSKSTVSRLLNSGGCSTSRSHFKSRFLKNRRSRSKTLSQISPSNQFSSNYLELNFKCDEIEIGLIRSECVMENLSSDKYYEEVVSEPSDICKVPTGIQPINTQQNFENGLKENLGKLRKQIELEFIEEYYEQLAIVCLDFEDKYNMYREFPKFYPAFEKYYGSFSLMYSKQYGTTDESHMNSLWKQFWESKYDSIKVEDWKIRQQSLLQEYETKIAKEISSQTVYVFKNYMTATVPFDYEEALSLLEFLCDKLPYLGMAIKNIITRSIGYGTTTIDGYRVFTEHDNIALLNMSLMKFENLYHSDTEDYRSLYEKVIDWIPKLLEEAKTRSSLPEANKKIGNLL